MGNDLQPSHYLALTYFPIFLLIIITSHSQDCLTLHQQNQCKYSSNYSTKEKQKKHYLNPSIRPLEIGYTLNTDVLKKVGIQKLRVFANGYNLLTFDHLGFIDPESKISNKNKYPNTRIYNFGVNVNF